MLSLGFIQLYVLVIVRLARRELVWINVTSVLVITNLLIFFVEITRLPVRRVIREDRAAPAGDLPVAQGRGAARRRSPPGQNYDVGQSYRFDRGCRALLALWARDTAGRPMLALLCALACDPSLRDGAAAVPGTQVRWAAIASALEIRAVLARKCQVPCPKCRVFMDPSRISCRSGTKRPRSSQADANCGRICGLNRQPLRNFVARRCSKADGEILFGARLQNMELQPESAGRRLQGSRKVLSNARTGAVDEQSNDGRCGYQFVQQLQPLRPDLYVQIGYSRQVPAGSVQAGDKPNLDRVDRYREDDWNGCGRRFGRHCRRSTAGRRNHVHLTPDAALIRLATHGRAIPFGTNAKCRPCPLLRRFQRISGKNADIV